MVPDFQRRNLNLDPTTVAELQVGVISELRAENTRLEAEVERLRALENDDWRARYSDASHRLDLACDGLRYVLDHHADGHGCLCGAGRSVAEASLRLTNPDGGR